jgi:hypothetical protein
MKTNPDAKLIQVSKCSRGYYRAILVLLLWPYLRNGVKAGACSQHSMIQTENVEILDHGRIENSIGSLDDYERAAHRW